MRVTRTLAAALVLSLAAGCGDSDCQCGAMPDAGGPSFIGTWTGQAPLSLGPRQEMGVAAIAGEVYVVGGFDGTGQPVDTVESYSVSGNRWTRRASLPAALHHVNLAAVGGKLYVVGALTGGNFAGSGATLVYDPALDAWSPLTSMPPGSGRGASGVAVLDGRIVVAGGYRGGASVADASVFDPQTNAWSPLQPLGVPRDHLAAGTVDGRVFAVAGRAGGALKGALEVLDAASNTWQRRADILTPRGGCAAATLDGRLVVMGGEGNPSDPSGVFPQTESYDPATDRWRTEVPMRTPRHGIGAATVGEVLVVPGGATREGFGAVDVNESFGYH
jgi:N-acetylneuraminic acid mutarotase